MEMDVQVLDSDGEDFWYCGRGTLWRMLNGSPPHISATKQPFVKISPANRIPEDR